MAKVNRKSSKVVTGVTPEQYQEAVRLYAQNDSRSRKLVAKMEKEITDIRAKYDADLLEMQAEEEKYKEVIQAYCVENKKILFTHARSMDTAFGKVGFRLGTPKLKTLPKFTWEKVLDKLKIVLPDYVRSKEEVDKERLLADRGHEEIAPRLNEVGVYVDQDEHFYIELNKEAE